MTTYQLTSESFVYRWRDGVRTTIPLVAREPGSYVNADAAEYAAWLEAGGVPEPADPPEVAEIEEMLRASLSNEYRNRMQVIAAGYPLSERESWPVQTEEARKLDADPLAITPWIDAAAQARGLNRSELAARIRAKDDAYRVVHGLLTGTRQRIEDAIAAASGDAQALSLIDVTAGWPSPSAETRS